VLGQPEKRKNPAKIASTEQKRTELNVILAVLSIVSPLK
jgi:hypothetical protein